MPTDKKLIASARERMPCRCRSSDDSVEVTAGAVLRGARAGRRAYHGLLQDRFELRRRRGRRRARRIGFRHSDAGQHPHEQRDILESNSIHSDVTANWHAAPIKGDVGAALPSVGSVLLPPFDPDAADECGQKIPVLMGFSAQYHLYSLGADTRTKNVLRNDVEVGSSHPLGDITIALHHVFNRGIARCVTKAHTAR